MPDPGPVIRGRHLKALLERLRTMPQGPSALARIGAGLVGRIDEGGGLDWFPAEDNVAATLAIYDVLGPMAADRFFRAQMKASFDGPILRTLATTAVAVFGYDPAALARWIPRAWDLLFRQAGTWRIGEATPGSVTLTLAGLPPVMDDPTYLRSVGCAMSALADLARVQGAATLQPRTRGDAEAVWVLRWSAAARPVTGGRAG